MADSTTDHNPRTDSFLSSDGLRYLWTKITGVTDQKVDKVDGKGLSTNDFTNEMKSKVEASLTEVNWNMVQNKPDVALKSDITTVYRYKGSVATYSALPTTNRVVGDVYNVEDTEMNYAWNGSAWDQLGSSQIEITAITNAEIDSIVNAS